MVPASAVVIQQQSSRARSSEAERQRQGGGGSSASEQQESGGLEHWEILPLGTLYCCTVQSKAQPGRRTSRNGYLGVVIRVYYYYYYPLRLSSISTRSNGAALASVMGSSSPAALPSESSK